MNSANIKTTDPAAKESRLFSRLVAYFLWFTAGAFFGYLWMAKAFNLI